MTTAGPVAGGPDAPDSTRWTMPLRVLGVAAMVAIVLFWFWIFSGGPRKQNADRLDDRRWVARAETTCARTMGRVDTRAEAAGRQDRDARAAAIDTSSTDLRRMLDDLRSPLPSRAGDRDVAEQWLGDWDRLIDDRDTYADAIRRNPDARFLTEEKFRDPLDRVIEIFADVNDMPSCGPAGDVG